MKAMGNHEIIDLLVAHFRTPAWATDEEATDYIEHIQRRFNNHVAWYHEGKIDMTELWALFYSMKDKKQAWLAAHDHYIPA